MTETVRYFLYNVEEEDFHEVVEAVYHNPPRWSNGNSIRAITGDPEHYIPQYDVNINGAFGRELVAMMRAVSIVQQRIVVGTLSPSDDRVALVEGQLSIIRD